MSLHLFCITKLTSCCLVKYNIFEKLTYGGTTPLFRTGILWRAMGNSVLKLVLKAVLKKSLLNGEKKKGFLSKAPLLKILANYLTTMSYLYQKMLIAAVEYGTEVDLILCIQMLENSLHIDRCLRCKCVRAEPVRSKKKILFACCFLPLSSNIHFIIIFMFQGKE